MMFDFDGMLVFKCFCEGGNFVFVFFFIVKDVVGDWVVGFIVGGDDYVIKLFSLEEVIV